MAAITEVFFNFLQTKPPVILQIFFLLITRFILRNVVAIHGNPKTKNPFQDN